jgi:hypothetical protein
MSADASEHSLKRLRVGAEHRSRTLRPRTHATCTKELRAAAHLGIVRVADLQPGRGEPVCGIDRVRDLNSLFAHQMFRLIVLGTNVLEHFFQRRELPNLVLIPRLGKGLGIFNRDLDF